MRIAVVAGVFPSLSETFVLNQVTGLIDRGHDVRVLAGRPGEEGARHPDWERYRLAERTTWWESRSRLLRRVRWRLGRLGLCRPAPRPVDALRSQGRFDAILVHFGHLGEQVRELRAAGLIEGPLAVVFHAAELTVLLRDRPADHYAPLFESAELLLPISRRWAEKLVAMGADEIRVRVVHMGIDTRLFRFRPRRREPGGVTELVTVARLVPKKGIATAIRAVAELARRGERGLRYRILGDGPLRRELEALARSEGVEELVQFLGWRDQDEVAGVLESSHLFLLPSETGPDGDMEGIPVSLMEAMAAGMPVLSTRHSGIPELIEDGVSGLLVDEGDAAALAGGLGRLLREPESWPLLGEAGRRRVEAEFDVRRNLERLEGLLEDLA